MRIKELRMSERGDLYQNIYLYIYTIFTPKDIETVFFKLKLKKKIFIGYFIGYNVTNKVYIPDQTG